MCGSSRYTRATFWRFLRRASYPVYVHNGSTRLAPVNCVVIHRLRWTIVGAGEWPVYPVYRAAGENSDRLTDRPLSQRTQQKACGVDVLGQIAFERPRLAFDLRRDQLGAERGPD